MLPITEVAASIGITDKDLIPYGRDKAKVDLAALDRPRRSKRPARLILVSAITPTPAGEGKTTTTIGLGQALHRKGESVCLALREPSLGPIFGVKGGGTGGGQSRLVPTTDINLHFTGDFHAITAAHNLLAAALDNHLHFGNPLGIDPRRVRWPRVMDMNDRALRDIVVGLGGPTGGVPRETGFDITAASEIMALLSLAQDMDDMRTRIDRILLGFTYNRRPVYASQLGVTGAMLALLKDALQPNLVQTVEGTPAFVHGGPFANIAHGCNSVLATRMALHHADWVITEAGFGFDLGAEKFFDIKCVSAGLDTAAVVLVATVRALKMHGGVKQAELSQPDPEAVARGLGNLDKHIENIRHFGEVPVVAINRFTADTEAEIAVIRARCERLGVPVAVSDHFTRGGEGAMALADAVCAHAEREESPFKPLYDWSAPLDAKIRTIADTMYGASEVVFTRGAKRELGILTKLGYGGLPVCMAKTSASLSDNPRLVGRPRDFDIVVEKLEVNAGAGFVVVFTGDILRMPGLPKRPSAQDIDVVDGQIVGLD